jgi:hypothetical protein
MWVNASVGCSSTSPKPSSNGIAGSPKGISLDFRQPNKQLIGSGNEQSTYVGIALSQR